MLLGLTGGIGCGKSTVLDIFRKLGWLTVDADAICAELYGDERVIARLEGRWGSDRIRGLEDNVDRSRIAEIVFADPVELRWLNSVFHPEVMKKAGDIIEQGCSEYTIFDVPLLYEAGWDESFDFIVAVWAGLNIQFERLEKRGWTRAHSLRRIKSQMPAGLKLEAADFGIINQGAEALLEKQCILIDKKIRTRRIYVKERRERDERRTKRGEYEKSRNRSKEKN
jgi:dephospho-CoA kinase